MTISTVSWPLGIAEPRALMAHAAKLGLQGVQFCGNHRSDDPQQVRAAARDAGLTLIAVDPIDCAPAEGEAPTLDNAVAFYRKLVDFTLQCGAGALTLQGLSQWTCACDGPSRAYQQLQESVQQVDSYARQQGIRLLYEVCNHYEVPLIHTAAECRQLLDRVGSDNIGIILDSFHMNINEPDPLQAIYDCADRLAIYHISDANRAGIGSGHIDFIAQHRALQHIGFTGPVAVELVLPHLTPTTPPQNAQDRQQLDNEITRSAAVWRALSQS